MKLGSRGQDPGEMQSTPQELFGRAFRLIANRIQEELELVRLHPPQLRGSAREALVRGFLNKFLPEHVGIGKGVVVSADGRQTGELDVVIYDRSGLKLFEPLTDLLPGELRVYPVETVYIGIEVESKLDIVNLRSAAIRLRELKELNKIAFYPRRDDAQIPLRLYGREWEHFPSLGMIFAFDSTNLKELCSELIRLQKDLEPYKWVDSVCVLNKGVLMYYDRSRESLQFPPTPGSALDYYLGVPSRNLSLFYQMLVYAISKARIEPIRITDYFDIRLAWPR